MNHSYIFCFYFESYSGFIDCFSFDSMQECINTWVDCSNDPWFRKVGKIFFRDSFEESV